MARIVAACLVAFFLGGLLAGTVVLDQVVRECIPARTGRAVERGTVIDAVFCHGRVAQAIAQYLMRR